VKHKVIYCSLFVIKIKIKCLSSASRQLHISTDWSCSSVWWFWVIPSPRTCGRIIRSGAIQLGTETQDAAPCSAHAREPDLFPRDLTELDAVPCGGGSACRRRVWNDHLQLRQQFWLGVGQSNIPWPGRRLLYGFYMFWMRLSKN